MTGNAVYRQRLDQIFDKHRRKDVFQIMNPQGEILHITFEELYSDILELGEMLEKRNLYPGDRVLLLDRHSPSVMKAFLTVTYWNLVPVMMDPGLPASEMDPILASLDLRLIFTSVEVLKKLPDSAKNAIPILDIRDSKYRELLPAGTSVAFDSGNTIPGNAELAVIVLSSGTTGKMKAIEISYRSFMNSIEQNSRNSGINARDTMLLVFPLFHVSGLDSAMTLFLNGDTLMMLDEFSPAELQRALHTFQPTGFGMVPKVFEIMVQKLQQELKRKSRFVQCYYQVAFRIASFFNRHFGLPVVGKILMKPFADALFGKKIRILVVGASECDPKTAETMLNMGLRWLYIYASTECGAPITSVLASDRYPCDTVGRVDSVENVDIMIKDPDIHGIGEVYVKTNQIMNGYFRDPELTEASFEQGYFKTGDLGYVDHQGYLHLTGRIKETILLQTGKKIAPADLETLLQKSGIPIEAAICGIKEPDSTFDQIHVFVKDKPFSDEERENCKREIHRIFQTEAAQYPIRQIHFVREIPKTAVGKIRRTLLKNQVLSEKTENAQVLKCNTSAQISRTEDELLELIISLLAARNDAVEHYDSDTLWKEISGMDSLSMIEILVKLEEETGVFIGKELLELATLRDIAAYLYSRQKS